MRPYDNRLQWNLKGRPHHIMDGLQEASKSLPKGAKDAFDHRVRLLQATLLATLVITILLYLGIIVTAAAWIVRLVPALSDALQALQTLVSALSGASALLLLLFLLLRRRIGQLEADLVTICISNR